MRPVLAAFRFLTILPVPGGHDMPDADWAAATAWYPLAGAVLGSLLAGLSWALGWLWPSGVVAVLVLSSWLFLTGALHLDGYIDCCDALFAAVGRERRLEILRDVHTGAFGVVGAVLLLLTKYAVLVDVLVQGTSLAALILVATVSRWGMTAAVVLYPYARSREGLGARAKGAGRATARLGVASATALLVAAATGWAGLGWGASLVFLAMAAAMFLSAQWMRSRLGGLTGDAYGALCELGETAGLLAAAALARQGWMP